MSSTEAKKSGASSSSRSYPVGQPVKDADAEAIVEAIQRSAHAREFDEMTFREQKRHCLKFLRNRLPGFGDPRDDCGERVPESTYFCADHGHLHRFPRNCKQYDCPLHAPHAVRRRAAGSESNAGICPKLDALSRWLGAYYGDSHGFYHVVVSPPDEWTFESDDPLGRAVGIGNQDGVIREIMDEFGLQGMVALHEFRGDHEDPSQNDMGEWKGRLAPFDDEPREWLGDVKEELKDGVHFHIVGVAHRVDLSVTEQVNEETDWVISVMEQEDGLRLGPEDGPHVRRIAAMGRVVTYCLSHASVLDVGDQRRLAAWMKGPDVNAVDVLEDNKRSVKAVVREAASDTLGILPPDLECDSSVAVSNQRPTTGLDRSPTSPLRDVLDGPQTPAGPSVPDAHTRIVESSVWEPSRPERREPGPGDLPEQSDDLWGTGGSTSGSSASTPAGGRADQPGDQDDDDVEECKGHLKHISEAWEHLSDSDWRDQAAADDELETGYVAFKNHLRKRGLELGEARRRDEIPEFRDVGPWVDSGPPD